MEHDLELSEAQQKWFVAIMLAGAVCYMAIALALAMPFMIMNNVLERIPN
jgi:hypothetical protein